MTLFEPVVLSRESLIHRVAVPAIQPFNLKLTALILRHTVVNVVDHLDDGVYSRAFRDDGGAWVVEARQTAAGFELRVYGVGEDKGEAYWAGLVGKMLGADMDLAGFYAAAAQVPGFAALAAEMAGAKPARFPTTWEVLANGIIFQQISLESASSIMNRFVRRFSRPVLLDGREYFPFPLASNVAPATIEDLRAVGCTTSRSRFLLAVANRLAAGDLELDALEALPNSEVIARLLPLHGVGLWTATISLMRGLGRVDVFPAADSGAAKSLRGLFDLEKDNWEEHTKQVLELLGPYKGMLYYHLLLWRFKIAGRL